MPPFGLVCSGLSHKPAFPFLSRKITKEWVHRAVQIALERLDQLNSQLELQNNDFRQAMDEMRRFSEGSTGRIIGFHSQ